MRKLSKNLVPFAAGLIALSFGCAKFPQTGDNLLTKRLVFTAKLSGKVRTGLTGGQQPYIYVFALRLSTDANPRDRGPVPVTSFGGNGFVAGNCTHYVVFNPGSTNPYEIWQFQDTQLNNRFQTGVAINFEDPRGGGRPNILKFEIDMSQLVPAADVNSIQSVQCNILTMDRLALSSSGHDWDAFGDGNIVSQDNTFLTFQTKSTRTISNTQTQLEPSSEDVRGSNDPDLDLRDWSVEIRLQQ
ncbi:MAG: hypothetical protein JNM34_10435 [Chthonomonadaceae bacterium]|nr:hypothetical protein [Chthonomonadaceae bacterium]